MGQQQYSRTLFFFLTKWCNYADRYPLVVHNFQQCYQALLYSISFWKFMSAMYNYQWIIFQSETIFYSCLCSCLKFHTEKRLCIFICFILSSLNVHNMSNHIQNYFSLCTHQSLCIHTLYAPYLIHLTSACTFLIYTLRYCY